MMREIMFRGKLDDGMWVYGDLDRGLMEFEDEPKRPVRIITEYNQHAVHLATVGQYVGLTDIHGDKLDVWEHDVIEAKIYEIGSVYLSETTVVGVVEYTDGCFFVNDYRLDRLQEVKIIGNIHDNPELLNEETKL